MTGVSTDKSSRKFNRDTGERPHGKMGTETGVKLSQAKPCPESPGTRTEAWNRFFLHPQKGANPDDTRTRDAGLQNGERRHIWGLKPPDLWSFVVAALRN